MKKNIALVTDSTCDLPADLLDKLSVELLPLKIIYKEKQFLDRVNIKPEFVYKRFEDEIPTTSMPGPGDFEAKFKEIKEKGFSHILAIHISGGLSSTANIARMVAEQFDDLTIEVIDSQLLSMGLGRLVLYARELIDKGDLDFFDIVKKTRNKINEIDIHFIVKTLKYLKEGGRIGKVRGTIGELFNIKPIISINDEGKYFTVDKSRSRNSSINKLYKIAEKKIRLGKCYLDVMHADALEEAEELLRKLKKLPNVQDSLLGEISPAMVVHAGPGLIGVCVTAVRD
ncbi:MAG: DegV family protein [Halanaerobiales bacterium]